VARDQGPLQMRSHRVVEAEDSGKWICAGPQLAEQVLPYLVLDAPVLMAACAGFTEGLDFRGGSLRGSR